MFRTVLVLAVALAPMSVALSFKETGQLGVSKTGVRGRRDVPELYTHINKNIEATQDSLAKTEQDCKAEGANQDRVIEQKTSEVELYNAQGSSAKADHARAETSITTLETAVAQFGEDAELQNSTCREQIRHLEEAIQVMKSDRTVLSDIILKLEDNNSPSLLQKNVKVQVFEKLQSQVLKHVVSEVMHDKKGSEEKETHIKDALNKSDRVSSTLQNGPVYSHANLLAKFTETASELDGDIARFTTHKSNLDTTCKLGVDNHDAQKRDLRERLGVWKEALAEATTRQVRASEGAKAQQAALKELGMKKVASEKTCSDVATKVSANLAVLMGVRKDLGMHSESPKFIEDCKPSEWRSENCTKECRREDSEDGGTHTLTRMVETAASLGAGCGVMTLTEPCGTKRCGIDCVQAAWTEWSACSKCGGGVRERFRPIRSESRFGGKPCGPVSQTETCSLQDCSKDCILGPWPVLSNQPCSKACGDGSKTAKRAILQEQVGSGSCPAEDSPERLITVQCNKIACQSERPPPDMAERPPPDM